MNGVEAAASLFGSEGSDTDLFAMLGTDTTSIGDPLPLDNDPRFLASEEQAYDLPSHAATYDSSVLAEHSPSIVAHESVAETSNHVHDFSHQGQWAQGEKNNPNLNYSALNPPPPSTSHDDYSRTSQTQPTTQSSYRSHDPQTQGPSALQSAYSPYAPPQATTHSTYSAYDPPPPLSTHTAYSAYYPPPAQQPTLQPPHIKPPVYAPYHVPEASVTAPPDLGSTPPTLHPTTGYNNHQFMQPVQASVTSSITRPKISNAYDPPFPAIKPTRRGGHSGGTHPVTSYKGSPPTTSYASSNGSSPAYSDPHYKQTSALQKEYRPASVEDSPHANFSESLADMDEWPSGKHSQDFLPSSNPEQTTIYHTEGEEPSAYQPANSGSGIGNIQNNVAHAYSHKPSLEIHEAAYSSPELFPSSTESTSRGALETASSARLNKSPTPPILTTEISHVQSGQLAFGGALSASDNTNGHPSQFNSFTRNPIPKRDQSVNKEYFDPYAPKVILKPNNSIPRTSSPLSVYHGRQHETRKQSVNLGSDLNLVAPYESLSIPAGAGISTPPANLMNEGYSSHPGSNRTEAKLSFQDVPIKPTVAQYAPSPSLIGANDPLSRTSARAPVVTFGFGGKMVTCFYGMPGLNAGFDVAFSSRTSSELKVRTLQTLLPESAMNSPGPSYPGPLLSDPGAASISIVRPNVANQTKTKKTALLSYLAERASEIHQGLGYLVNGEKQAAENKLILVKLLGVMIENDGRLLGTTTSDPVVRSILVPRLEASPALQDATSLQASFKPGPSDEPPISVTTLRPSALDRIEELLLQGDRRQAYQFAADEQLWAHAMIIASSIDKEAWKEVINEFLRSELGTKENTRSESFISLGNQPQRGRESIRVAYSLFSGQGALSVQELATPNLLQRGFGRLLPPSITPRTPNFAPIQPPSSSVPLESLAKWAEIAAMVISSPMTTETSAALTALGDQLLANDWVEAAHACYLLSPQTSVIGGLGSLSAKITIVGSKNPADIMKDMDPLILSEILEFALALVPAIKGQDAFHGMPHLQAYRFIRAVSLAEVGDMQLANRYCDAIAASLHQSSPYTTPALLAQLQGLQQRLSGVFHGDKSGSWIGGKLSKPSLDTIGGWLEGRFTKLVTGESDSSTPTADDTKTSEQTFIGPFAHYSTISSTTPSARSSPQLPTSNLTFPPPQRTSSAMATATPYSHQIERSSSAMGYMQQKPAVQTSLRSSSSVASSQSSPGGFGFNGYSRAEDLNAPNSEGVAPDELETPIQGGSSWWGSSNDNSQLAVTPTATTFMQVEESSIPASSDGLISLMDNQPFSIGPNHVPPPPSSLSQEIDDEDDLGLGNSKPKSIRVENQERSPVATNEQTPTKDAPRPEKKAEPPAASGGSWLGRWWKGSDSTTPGPIKASLGEESAFYYDKEQKKWVNKKAGNEEPPKPAAPPPPPSRAQTASPGMSGPKAPPQSGPPLRSASAIDLTTEPPTKVPMRIRSNLAPPTESAPSTPTGTRLNPSGPPPPMRPKSQASKRNIRSRYVDVFQQESGGA